MHSDGRAEPCLPVCAGGHLNAASSRWTNRTPARLLERGDAVRVRRRQGRAMAAGPGCHAGSRPWSRWKADTGALRALVGGYSFAGNKFNRATRARRQARLQLQTVRICGRV